MKNEDNLPTVISSEKLKFGDMEIEVHDLSNGQRVISEEDLINFFDLLAFKES